MPVVSNDSPLRKDFLWAIDIPSMIVSLGALPLLAVFMWQRYHNAGKKKRFTIATALCLLVGLKT